MACAGSGARVRPEDIAFFKERNGCSIQCQDREDTANVSANKTALRPKAL